MPFTSQLRTPRVSIWPRSSPRRFYATEAPPKALSPHIGFYKTFGRPVAKVLLMATFVYQLTYWAWVKLEADEMKDQRTAELVALENHIRNLAREKKA
ncbi:hypothetical protein K3495_g3121 [Podosphaera aphanis]|nr:hypothetical protein K3495_g3121 [Podosphaera aphanis]